MNIICASICYRGYTDDEVAGTLELAPKIGYKLMEIHGPMMWSVEAVDAFDPKAVKKRIEAAKRLRTTSSWLVKHSWRVLFKV